jgi:hypothetical protein
MMKIGFLAAAAVLISAAAPAPATAPARTEIKQSRVSDGCWLANGCFYTNTDDGGFWTCSDPLIYAVCKTSDG